MIQLMTLRLEVASAEAPLMIYYRALLRLDYPDGVESLYRRLCAGGSVEIDSFDIRPCEKEEPATLLAEQTLALCQLSATIWSLSMIIS